MTKPIIFQKSGQVTSYGLMSGTPEVEYISSHGACVAIKLSWRHASKCYGLEARLTLPDSDYNRYLLAEILTKNYSDLRFIKRWAKKLAKHYVWNTPHLTNGDGHFTNAMCAFTKDYPKALAILKEKVAPMAEEYRLRCLANSK